MSFSLFAVPPSDELSARIVRAMPEPRFQLLFPETWPRAALAGAVLLLATLIAWHGTLGAPFVFDDLPGIVRNPSLRQWWPPGDALLPAQATGTGVVGRPVVNLSLALNYAVGGLDVRGYHVVNWLIHAAAGFLLFALLERLFRRPPLRPRFGSVAFPLSLGAALLWTLHPLQTEAVTCVIQRAESLAGFFQLLTLYAFVRAAEEDGARRRWSCLAVVACALGVATKESVVTAPVLAWLFDRTFYAGGWREAWRRRRALHLALAATWLPLAWLVARSGGRGGTAGFDVGVSVWDYLLTQARAIVLYLRLTVWPDPLVLDYGQGLVRHPAEVWPQLLLVVTLAALTAVVLVRRPVLGLAGAWFFVTLAPSSSFVPLATQTMAEHRMYLPLAAVAVTAAAGAFRLGGRRGLVAVFGLALVAGAGTLRRNADYESALTLWGDTVAHAPANPRAHYHLANALSAAGRAADAVAHYETALRLEPAYAAAHYNLAGALLQLGRAEAAVGHYEAALRLEPGSADTHVNLAAALIRLGRGADAVRHYEAAGRSGLLAAEEQLRFGRALAEIGRLDDALARLREAQRLNPKHAETRVVIGMVLSAAGRAAEALAHFTDAVVLDPEDAGARAALGDALLETDRPAEALSHYEAALRLRPGQAAPLHTSLGNALIRLGRIADAIGHYEEALRLNPADAEARANLASVRAAAQRRGLLKH